MSLPLILEFHENISMSSQHLLVMKSLSENCGSDKWTDLLNFPQRGSSRAGIWIQLCLNLKVGPLVLKVLELTACTLLCSMSGISDSLVLLRTNQNVHLCKIMRWIVCSFKFEYHHPRRVFPKCPAKWFCFQNIKSWLIFLPVEFGQHSTAISNHTVGAQTFVEEEQVYTKQTQYSPEKGNSVSEKQATVEEDVTCEKMETASVSGQDGTWGRVWVGKTGKMAWSPCSKECFVCSLRLHPEQQRDSGTKEGDKHAWLLLRTFWKLTQNAE